MICTVMSNIYLKATKNNKQILELKDEILSNLEAKVVDLTSSGLEYSQAVSQAINSIENIDFLIDDNKKVYINKYRIELIQIAWLYCLIAWVITIPLNLIGVTLGVNVLLFGAVVILGILFIALYSMKKNIDMNKVSIINLASVLRYRKFGWLIWSLFVAVMTLRYTAIQFGSTIWFSRSLTISGPYQFAVLAIHYALPFISIIIPLLFQASLKLSQKYEVGD